MISNRKLNSPRYQVSLIHQRIAEIDHSAVCITFRSGWSHKSKSEAGGQGKEGGEEVQRKEERDEEGYR
jgi:hypothetical protein